MDDYFIRLLKLFSHISQPLVNFIEDLLFGRDGRLSHDSNVSLSGFQGQSLYTAAPSSQVDCCSHLECVDPSSLLVERSKSLTQLNEDPSASGTCEVRGLRQSKSFISRWLSLPACCLRLGCRLASSFWRCSCSCVTNIKIKVSGFLCRVKRTLLGSSEDIGWLRRTEGFPPVEDGTTRFMELLNDIRNGKHCLPNTLVYLLIPGLFSNHGPLYFVKTKRFFSKMGLTSHIARIHSEASVEKNAWELKEYIEELYWGSGKRVLLLGHSKGGVDAAAALAIYWPELKEKVAGLALVQSPYGGSPIASDILREGQIGDKEARKIMEFIICKIVKGDMTALDDLTYEKRKDFITRYKFPSQQIPLISFHTEASIAPGVLMTMSLIAHAELPWISVPSFFSDGNEDELCQEGRKVPVVIPIAAAMALSALHLKLRYGESSDGLVTRCDAEVPGSVVVRPQRKLDHAWMVYSTVNKDDVEADSSEMCEALLTMLVEMGTKKEESAISV